MTTPKTGQPRKVSPAVFRRRRLVVGLGLLAVIVAVILIIVQPGGATPTPAASPGPSSTNSIDPAPATSPAGGITAGDTANVASCLPADLVVSATTDAADYQAGILPQLSLTITNTGTTPCVYNVGTSQQVLTITSGAETYWISSDCQTDPSDLEAVLEPGKTETSAPVQWSRERSAADACDTPGAQVPAEGASYYLTANVGDVAAKESRQFLLY
jgi:hypothetical protein